MAILFADSFNSYLGTITPATGGVVSTADGLVKAGYEQPYDLGSNRWSAGVYRNGGKLNSGNCMRLCWQTANSAAMLSYNPPAGAIALTRKFSFHWERFICLSSQIKLSKQNTNGTGTVKIPLIKFGPVTVYALSDYDAPNNIQIYKLFANDSAPIGRMDSTQWTSLDVEINREEKKLRVWLSNVKVWEVDSDYFTTQGFEYIGYLRPPHADSTTLTAHVGWCDLDSIVIMDGSGPKNNTRTTSLTAKTLAPDTATVGQFSSVGAANQVLGIADTFKNNTIYDAQYRTSPTLGAYDLAKVGTPGEIAPLAVQVATIARGESSDSPPVKLTTRLNSGSLQFKKPQPHAGVWRQQKTMFELAPDDTNWNVTSLQNFEFGYTIATQADIESLVNGGFEYLVFGAPGSDLFDVYRGDVDPAYIQPSQVEYVPPLETLPNSGPGPKTLKGGTSRLGYFGTVTMAELFPTRPLDRIVGLTAGTSVNPDTVWLKFINAGKTLYVAKKPMRMTVSWADLYALGIVYGAPGPGLTPAGTPVDQDKKIVSNGFRYVIRLLDGADSNPSNSAYNANDPVGSKNSEWSRLIHRVWETDPNSSFWEQFTVSDLGVNEGGISYLTWCRETHTFGATHHVLRGYPGVSGLAVAPASYTSAPPLQAAWRPVLEYLGETTDPDTSPVIPDPTITDPTMGPKTLAAGTVQAGYYGLVTQSEMTISNDELATLLGVTEGTSIHATAPWLKFSWKGKTIFTPQAPIRRSVVWQTLYQLGLVYGVDGFGAAPSGGNKNQIRYVDLDGWRFKVRLFNGADLNPSDSPINSPSTTGTENCEWDNLMEKVYSGSPDGQRWASFSDSELGSTDSDITICQENHTFYGGTTLADTPARVVRGYPVVTGMSVTQATTNAGFGAYASWRPVLEFVGPAPVAGYNDPTWSQMSFAEGIAIDDVSETPLTLSANSSIVANRLVNTNATDTPLTNITPMYFSASEDFSIEGWMNLSSIPSAATILAIYPDDGASPNLSIAISAVVGSVIAIINPTGAGLATGRVTQSAAVALNQDHHLAMCRVSGTLTLYLNGVPIYSGANNSANFKSTEFMKVRFGAIGKRWNMRVMRGKSAYNGAFTPPAALPSIVIPNYADDVAADIVFQTSFRRNSLNDEVSGTPLTLSGGNVAVANGRLNVSPGGSLSRFQKIIPYFGAGDFTIECLLRFPAAPATGENCVFGQYINPGQANSWLLWFSSGLGWIFYYANQSSGGTGVAGVSSTKVFPVNVDVHVVVERFNGVITLYMDGVACGTQANNAPLNNNSATIPVRNWWGDNSMSNTMSIKYMRIAKRAMYKGVIKPTPTFPLIPAKTPMFSLLAGGALPAGTTNNGSVVVAIDKLTFPVGGYLSIPNDPTLALGSGDFRIDFDFTVFSVNAASGSSFSELMFWGTFASPSQPLNLEIGYNHNGQTFYVSGSNSDANLYRTFAFTLALSTAYKVSFVRSGGILYLFVNGTKVGETAFAANLPFNVAAPILIGRRKGGTAGEVAWNSNMEVRSFSITK